MSMFNDERDAFPMAEGCLYYFTDALAWVSRCSKVGNDQHNPGEPMHWAMDKSTDHANKILRHLAEAGTDDQDGIPHSVKVAWRALALAQEDLMARKGASKPRNARGAPPPATVPDDGWHSVAPGSFVPGWDDLVDIKLRSGRVLHSMRARYLLRCNARFVAWRYAK